MRNVFLLVALAGIVAVLTSNTHGAEMFSLHNTNFVVLLSFLIFVGILLYAGVPGKLAAVLDARAARIKADLEEARALRDEAKALLASYEAKQIEVREQSARIIAQAKEEAQAAAAKAKDDLKQSIARRLAAAEDQIASAEAGALRQIREGAITVAIAAAADVLAKQATPETATASIDDAIAQVQAKFH
ncbi:MAG: ATP F0F1 synthase subunit B [Cypionkella sp.]